MADNEIMIVDERSLKDKIYYVRGVQVMLDFELAEIYGYETRYFNRQIKNNLERFSGDDFMFQLTAEEFENLKCKIFTSSWGGRRKLPYAFTEQGIYMLMTVLRGDLAVEQSRNLIRLFKEMKDFISENATLFTGNGYVNLIEQIEDTNKEIRNMKEEMLTRADLPEFMKLFDQGLQNEEILILDGQPFKADVAYQKIYRNKPPRVTRYR